MTVDPVKVVGLPLEDFYSGRRSWARGTMGYGYSSMKRHAAMPIESGELSHWCYDLIPEQKIGFRLCRTRSVNP